MEPVVEEGVRTAEPNKSPPLPLGVSTAEEVLLTPPPFFKGVIFLGADRVGTTGLDSSGTTTTGLAETGGTLDAQ
jgi:hypothetical protein